MKLATITTALLLHIILPANAQLSAQVLPDRASFEEVFAASHRFYPGQRILIRIDGQIDANHRYWEDRECSWFGMRCKWVKREASNLIGVDRLPLLLAFEPVDILSAPIHTNEPQWIGNPNAKHVATAVSGTYDLEVKIPNAETSVDAFSSGVTLKALVADKYDQAHAINRGQCHHRPAVCSSGALKVTVDVSNVARLGYLAELLKTRRSSSDILSRRAMDPLLVQDGAAKAPLADLLFSHANAWHTESSDEARRSFLAFASFASSLNPMRADILNALAKKYIELGELAEGSKHIEESLALASKQYTGPGTTTVDVVLTLAEAKGMKASVARQQRAGVVGTDLNAAVALYRESAKHCDDEAKLPTVSPVDKAKLFTCAKDQLINAGRTLAMLRSRDNLLLAERIFGDAQEAAKRAVDEGGAT